MILRLISLSLVIISSMVVSVNCHGSHGGEPKLLFIYTDVFTEELKSLMLNKVNVSWNTSSSDTTNNILRYIIFGCEKNFTRVNCSKSCLPIWALLRHQKIRSSVIGLPYEFALAADWPFIFYGEDILKMGLTRVLKRMKKALKKDEVSFVMMFVPHDKINSTLSIFSNEDDLNIIVVASSLANSEFYMTGPSFVSSQPSQEHLRPVNLYLLIAEVFRVTVDPLCHDGNISNVSKFISKNSDFLHWGSLITMAAIICTALTLSLVMITMGVKGVCARKLKSNRFNLGARIDNHKSTKQIERNYLLDSSDDEELFSGTARDPSLPTLLRIDDNLVDIALH